MFKKKAVVVDNFALNSAWYNKDATAVQVKKMLDGKPTGNFVIRNSTSEPGNFVLTYMVDGAIKNAHLESSSAGVQIAKASQKFSCLTELVKYYSENNAAEIQTKLTGADIDDDLNVKTLRKQAKEREKEEKRKNRSSKVFDETMRAEKGSKWKTQDVCDWLAAMEMSEYMSTFKKNKVDGVALLKLSDQDLKELGVMAVGHRKKISQAIEVLNEKFDGRQGQPAASGQPVATIGLVARKVNGVVKIFDTITGIEVLDIAAHQEQKRRELANGPANAPPPKVFGASDHEGKEWWQKYLPKSSLAPLLESQADGTFVVRDSSSNPGAYAFSYVFQGKVLHKLIEPSGKKGIAIKGSSDIFPNLATLIDFHVNNPSPSLKCVMRYPPPGYTRGIAGAEGEGGGPPDAALPVSPSGGGRRESTSGGQHWNCLHLNKDQALARINGKPEGSFVIRPSDKAYAALSLMKPDGKIFHQHIDEVPGKGLQLKKTESFHADLQAFVEYFATSEQQGLPCPLQL
eukprot:m.14000 g.14000  ORF g.14000 m.14000 type:complete len:515 (+) comp4963_c0_seq1:215-1759(+)